MLQGAPFGRTRAGIARPAPCDGLALRQARARLLHLRQLISVRFLDLDQDPVALARLLEDAADTARRLDRLRHDPGAF